MGKQLKSHPASLKFKMVLELFTTNNLAETARKYGWSPGSRSALKPPFRPPVRASSAAGPQLRARTCRVDRPSRRSFRAA